MSLASWKREFYRTPADKISKRYALRHSFKKWTGLLVKNRKKHQVVLHDATLSDNNRNKLEIDGNSCALCLVHHYCLVCPLRDCGNAYVSMSCENKVSPMINLLRRAIKKGN